MSPPKAGAGQGASNLHASCVRLLERDWKRVVTGVAVCKDLNLEFVTKNSSCHGFAGKKMQLNFELSRAQRARSLATVTIL